MAGATSTILYLQYIWRLSSNRLGGIYRYARKAGWHVQVLEWGRTDMPTRDALRFWRPAGCIVEGGYVEASRLKLRDFGRIPVVFCDVNPKLLSGPYSSVEHDSLRSVELVFEEFRRLGRQDVGFVGTIRPKDWSARREEYLSELVERSGGRFHAFVRNARARDAKAYMDALRRWIRDIPKPCGVMGANDTVADLVLQACRWESLSVPEDVAVLGIDNDELICENAVPTLSSVELDFEQSGYQVAEMLDGLMSSPRRRAKIVPYGPSRLVRRGSTFTFVRRDDGVLAALDLIRRSSGCGVTAAEVLATIGGSRRGAEVRFRSLTGRSVGAAIIAARIERAKRLILKGDRQLCSVYVECGYESDAALRRAFKQVTGLSPRDWRDAQSVRR